MSSSTGVLTFARLRSATTANPSFFGSITSRMTTSYSPLSAHASPVAPSWTTSVP